MTDITHGGEFSDGAAWEVEITPSRVFQAFDVLGLEGFEVCTAEGLVFANWHKLPMELTREQAVAVSALLMEAAHRACE